MSILATVTRPMPAKREFLRSEAYLGRYSQQNLMLLCWIERMMQIEKDKDLKYARWVVQNVLDQTPFKEVAANRDLYK